MSNKVYGHNKRMWKNNSGVDSIKIVGLTASDWVSILRQYNFCCAGCGVHGTKNTILTLDHIYPLSLGGLNLPYNIQPLCEECHKIKDLAPTTRPWEMKKVLRKAAKTERRKNQRNKDFAMFKKLGIFPASEWFVRIKQDYDKNEEFKFYKNLHEYIIERLLMYWLDKTMGEKKSYVGRSFDQAA